MSALTDLIAVGEKFPDQCGSLGFVTDLNWLMPVLAELTPRVPASINTVRDDGDYISFDVRIGFTIGRSELSEVSA